MVKDRILSTLKFFDLQDYPLTLLELHAFLLPNEEVLKLRINNQWELIDNNNYNNSDNVSIAQIAECLDGECKDQVEEKNGFYCLRGRTTIIDLRLANYLFGIRRERLIRKFAKGLRHIPFVRGAGLAGSQAQGLQKENSDIDLLIIAEPGFLWLARTLVTAYFQILGLRRHGSKIANRFCLNHYLAGVKEITELKNLYTALEYAKLRPLGYGQAVAEFQEKNRSWITGFFPNFQLPLTPSLEKRGELPPSLKLPTSPRLRRTSQRASRGDADKPSSLQNLLEKVLSGRFGRWLEIKLKNWQLPKIRQEEFILVRDDELSFHPKSKQRELLGKFFLS